MFGALADATGRDIVRRAIEGEEGVAELTTGMTEVVTEYTRERNR